MWHHGTNNTSYTIIVPWWYWAISLLRKMTWNLSGLAIMCYCWTNQLPFLPTSFSKVRKRLVIFSQAAITVLPWTRLCKSELCRHRNEGPNIEHCGR